jgi:hypothetical protein
MENKELKITLTDPATGRVLIDEMVRSDLTFVTGKVINERPCELRVTVRIIETADGRMSIEA